MTVALPRTVDGDGYVQGQRDRALVLDLFAEWDRVGTCNSAWYHSATELSDADVNAACDALVADGLLVPDWLTHGLPNLTPAGLAAHRAAQSALDAIGAGLEEAGA